jgi:hypothetical protein
LDSNGTFIASTVIKKNGDNSPKVERNPERPRKLWIDPPSPSLYVKGRQTNYKEGNEKFYSGIGISPFPV